MESKDVKKWMGKKAIIILEGNIMYTGIIPDFEGTSFTLTDKFNEQVSIDCRNILFIRKWKIT